MKMVDRDAWLLERAANRVVMHVGCTDAPFTNTKAEKNQLLHQKLGRVCKSLIGIDIDRTSLEYLRKHHRIDDLYCHDIEHLDSFPRLDKVDVVIAGEVLEHLNNAGFFSMPARPDYRRMGLCSLLFLMRSQLRDFLYLC